MSGRRALSALLALGLVTVGCSGVPHSGSVQVVSRVADQGNQNNVVAPAPGQPPDSIVRGFISASGQRATDSASGTNLAAAAQYLTSAAQRQGWPQPKYSTTILAGDPKLDWDPRTPTQVHVTGVVAGTLDASGSFLEDGTSKYSSVLHLVQVDGQWRITDPPEKIVITQRDFQTNYVTRLLYFLDASGTVLVPDQRYLNSPTDSLPGKLVGLLIGGPAGVLAGVAGNRLDGAELHSSVRVDADASATLVDITGVTLPSTASRRALAAQIVYTLTHYRDADQVEIKVGGDLLDPDQSVYTLSALQSFDPDRTPATGLVAADPFYINPLQEIVGVNDAQNMWGRLGNGSLRVRTAAMSAATGAVAAVAATDDGSGVQLVIGQPLAHLEPLSVLKADTLTQPSFSRAGDEVWVVQNGASKPAIYQISTTVSDAERPSRLQVQVDLNQAKGEVAALQVSPDGVRVAMIIGGRAYLGAVLYTDRTDPSDPAGAPGSTGTGGTAATTTPGSVAAKTRAIIKNLRPLGTNLLDVEAVTFNTATELMVGAKYSTNSIRSVTRLGIDGSEQHPVTSTDLNDDVDAITVAPSGPDAGMLISSRGRIYQLSGPVAGGRWITPNTPVIKTSTVLEGDQPFFPS